jgi:hypothetical protein
MGDSRGPEHADVQAVVVPPSPVVPVVVLSDCPLVKAATAHGVLHHDGGRVGNHLGAFVARKVSVLIDDCSQVDRLHTIVDKPGDNIDTLQPVRAIHDNLHSGQVTVRECEVPTRCMRSECIVLCKSGLCRGARGRTAQRRTALLRSALPRARHLDEPCRSVTTSERVDKTRQDKEMAALCGNNGVLVLPSIDA